jgi:hypothetical protein
VDVSHARLAAWRSRTGYASAATSHPKNALARRNRGVPDRKGRKRHHKVPFHYLCTGRKGQDSERHEVFVGKESKKQQ